MLFDNEPLYVLSEELDMRWASMENQRGEKGAAARSGGGRKGAPCFGLQPGEQRILAEETGKSGMIRRIWATIIDRSPEMLRGLRLNFYWDDAEKPAVSAPFGDFFGIGLGRTAPFQSALFTNPEGRSFNCYIPMPFRTGMKIVVTNESEKNLTAFYYDIDYTVGDKFNGDMLYFHAYWHRECETALQKDFEILPWIDGKGRFLGANIGVIANTGLYHKAWWGEGEVKIYLDGDNEFPTLCSTGTEDYIGTGWSQGRYDNMYQGCPVADFESMQFCFYRYHIPDPVYFRQQIKVTIQQLGCWDPDTRPLLHHDGNTIYSTTMNAVDFSKDSGVGPFGIFERSDDWSSCAYFYLDRPENKLPELDRYTPRI